MMTATVRVPYPDVDLTSHSPSTMRFWDDTTLEGQAPYIEPAATFHPTRKCVITHCSLVIEGGEYDVPRFRYPIRLQPGDTFTLTVYLKRC